MGDEPGTPVAEQITDIAKRLKEIEEERARERQAGTLPDVVQTGSTSWWGMVLSGKIGMHGP